MSRYKSNRQDYFPNYMSWKITESAADTYTTDKIFTPIPRSQVMTGNKAVVMELLWLEITCPNITFNAGEEFITCGIQTGGVPIAAQSIDEGNVIGYLFRELSILTEGGSTHDFPMIYDFQSKDGFGMLLGTDAFHAWVFSGGTGVALAVSFRLYYRFVQVPVTEYIGIVQSQQTS